MLAGRVRSLCADLTRHGAVADIGVAARRLGVALRVLYLSNAEEYWERLPQPFRDNLRALPVDERVASFASGGDPSRASLYFQYGRYLLIASSRPGSQPANLQGIWKDSLSPPWGR